LCLDFDPDRPNESQEFATDGGYDFLATFAFRLYGAETRSRCKNVLVNQSAETIATSNTPIQ
jgi:hypothetical protein